MKNTIRIIVEVAVLGALIAYFWNPLRDFALQTYSKVAPCTIPISYKIGSIDPRFGVSTSTFQADITEAIRIWNGAAGRMLFTYDQKNGNITVNLRYDSRQATTAELSKLGITLRNDRASYDQVKAKYNSLSAVYLQKKTAFQNENTVFINKERAYAEKVNYWNARGGAPRDVYDELQTEKAVLGDMQTKLEREKNEINAQAADINALIGTLNNLINTLNLDAKTYNTVGASNGAEFEQGLYESSFGKRTITIFEFANHTKLVRVLAHEFGHALGMEHVDDSGAIMYPLNQGNSLLATGDDMTQLRGVCRLPAVTS